MAKYLISFSYTPEAWAKMIQNPSDRSVATRAVLEPVGGTLECFYYTFGEGDGFVIVEVPDADAAAAAAIAVASTGSFRSVTTQELIDPRRMIDVLGKAGRGVGVYPKPGGWASLVYSPAQGCVLGQRVDIVVVALRSGGSQHEEVDAMRRLRLSLASGSVGAVSGVHAKIRRDGYRVWSVPCWVLAQLKPSIPVDLLVREKLPTGVALYAVTVVAMLTHPLTWPLRGPLTTSIPAESATSA